MFCPAHCAFTQQQKQTLDWFLCFATRYQSGMFECYCGFRKSSMWQGCCRNKGAQTVHLSVQKGSEVLTLTSLLCHCESHQFPMRKLHILSSSPWTQWETHIARLYNKSDYNQHFTNSKISSQELSSQVCKLAGILEKGINSFNGKTTQLLFIWTYTCCFFKEFALWQKKKKKNSGIPLKRKEKLEGGKEVKSVNSQT